MGLKASTHMAGNSNQGGEQNAIEGDSQWDVHEQNPRKYYHLWVIWAWMGRLKSRTLKRNWDDGQEREIKWSTFKRDAFR